MTGTDTRQLWQNALGELQLQMRPEDFRTWFRNTHLLAYDGDRCIVGTENPFHVERILGADDASIAVVREQVGIPKPGSEVLGAHLELQLAERVLPELARVGSGHLSPWSPARSAGR